MHRDLLCRTWPALSLAKTKSGHNEDRDCELDGCFGSGLRFGTGRSLPSEYMENIAKRRRQNLQAHLSIFPSSTLTRSVSSGCSGSQIIAIMQTTESSHGYDLATRARIARHLATGRRSLCQCEMSSILVVVADVFIHKSFQMSFIQNDHVVKQIAGGKVISPYGCTHTFPPVLRASVSCTRWLSRSSCSGSNCRCAP